MTARPTTDDIIRRAIKVHGDRYGYWLVHYTNAHTPIWIVCHEHGPFPQIPGNHTHGRGGRGSGCPECAHNRRLTTADFVRRAIAVHGHVYDYSASHYVDAHTPLKIGCRRCGHVFLQAPLSHVGLRAGCPWCAGLHRYDTGEWKKRARAIHGDHFDYSHVIYRNNRVPVEIGCRRCGRRFWQKPALHTDQRCGCPACHASHGEAVVAWLLDRLGVRYTREWTDPTCRHKSLLPFDFHLPDVGGEDGALIEFDGDCHRVPPRWSTSMTDEEAAEVLAGVQHRDAIKTAWAAGHDVPLLRLTDVETVGEEIPKWLASLSDRRQNTA